MSPDFFASAADVGPLGTLPLTDAIPDDAEFLAGECVLLELVGRGGSGEVYRALQLSTRREVAVKRLRAGRSDARFDQEVQVLGRLNHPGIARLFHAGVADGRPFLVMEFVAGGSLADRLGTGPLPPIESARILREAAEAVQHAHDAGVVHRDIKPGNLLLDVDGRVRVTDFSVAKDLASDDLLTLDGQALGTPAYMAPEQFGVGGGSVGPATDVHGLGATLYHAVTGQVPYAGGDGDGSVGPRHSRGPDWGRDWEGIHRDLRTICMRAMHPDPARRFASAGELAADLGRFLNGQPIVARPETVAERLARLMWRPWPLAIFATLTALIIGAATSQVSTVRQQRTRLDTLLADWPKPAPRPLYVRPLGNNCVSGLRASFNSDGRVFAWGAANGQLRIASVEPFRVLANSLRRTPPVRFHQFLPGITRTNLFVAAEDGGWRVWTAGAVRLVVLEGKAEGGVTAFDSTENGRRFVVGAGSGEIVGWDLDQSRRKPTFRARVDGNVVGLHLSSQPDQLLSVSGSGAFQCWNQRSDQSLWKVSIPGGITATAINPDRTQIAIASGLSSDNSRTRGVLQFHLASDGSEVARASMTEAVRSMCFSPDGTRLMVTGRRFTGRVMDARGKNLFDTGAHSSLVVGGEFSPDGLRLLTWDADGVARLWDAHSGKPLTDFWSSPGGIAHATFSPDGWRIGSGDVRPTGTLWDGGCPVPPGWDRASLTVALMRQGGLEAWRRAVWLNPTDPELTRRLAQVTREQSRDPWRETEASFLERRAEQLTRRSAKPPIAR